MSLSREEVKHIGLLARLGLSETDIEKFRHQLSHILENFEILREANTEELPPTAHPVALQNVLRADEATPSYTTKEILDNAPKCDGDYFKIRAVLE